MLVFLHIPKTAGTSFGSIIADMLSVRHPACLVDDDLERGAHRVDAYDFLAGHFTFHGIAHHLPDARILTMLRHPVARAISQYQSWHDVVPDQNWQQRLQRDDVAANALAFAQRADIREYFASDWEPITRQFTNYQAYILSGRHIPTTGFKVWDRPVLQEAKDNLAKEVMFFGLTERMGESLALLQRTGGNGAAPKNTHQNPSRRRSDQWDIPEVVRQIESHSPMDLELYHWAEEEFKQRLAAASITSRPTDMGEIVAP